MQSTDLRLRLPDRMQLPVPRPESELDFHREELLSWHVDPETERVRFLSLIVGDREAVRDVAGDLEVVHQFELTPVDEDTFYAYAVMDLRAADATLMGAFDEPGLVIVPPIVYTGRETVHVTILGEPDALARLLEGVPDDVGVEVERVSDHQRSAETLAGRLTARQFEAMETARELGYYDVPRSGALAEVATELGCSESTASSLLRTVESKLVDAALGR
ncbi:helix-turn-helix domain-containing protein [Halobacteria archaeon AArc-m2/3/4]|uniref:Helix-turn-helix domain-containing protein n=1 Tax=Natronoglomus mannanivorans TaxID=2979990 RepID=A0AAP3E393_9EURY|nr:helix-turn-helix domain-containing protein [Halobacteria archaeon AArc-xg1-1]MCU4972239.1 helix-turn-helix domain-containing protein [Halobacteria archaeon AArc-m2/3/4]